MSAQFAASSHCRENAEFPNPVDLRAAMRNYVTGVTVVTARSEDGGLAGMTANSFTSVSLDPPLVLVCLANHSRSYEAIRHSGQVAIHILGQDQANLARAFAGQGADRSGICSWSISARGNPILDTCLTVLECDLHHIEQAGDHAIIIARVEAIERRSICPLPLVYHDGRMLAFGATSLPVTPEHPR